MTGVRFSREVSLGHILQAITIAAAVAAFFMRVEARVEVLEVRHTALADRVERNEARATAQMAEIRETLRRIEDKLDKKADKR